MEDIQNDRFFTMNQLWQSLGITAFVVGALVLVVGFGMHGFEHLGNTDTPVTTATTTPSGAAAVAAALPVNPFTTLHLSGQSAIVVDLSNGHTLYSQNPDEPLPLASLTKLLTMYGATDALSANAPVVISSTSLAQDGDYGLSEGEVFGYKDLARFALVASSNDAAEAIAEAAAASANETTEQFLANAASNAGLTRTSALNGTGLDLDLTHASAYGSARDIAKLAGELLTKAPDIAQATTKSSVTARSTDGVPHSLANTNPDVAHLPGILLSKTGYTDLAGGNLAVIFDVGINHPVAVVVLGSTRDARFTDVEKLMHATLAQFADTTQ